MLALAVITITLFFGVQATSQDVQQNITAEGYPAETHHVTTKDGYILELHRIPHGKSSVTSGNGTRKVVFLMHSILAGSNSFIYAGPQFGIAFNLADAGYDVWMGNARGNRYSRQHVSLDPDTDKFKFFDFSYEEIGLLDLPAMIDYILDMTKQDKLHYIGHTQGGSVFLVLMSMNTIYQSKIASAHLLAGIGYEKYFPQKTIKLFSKAIDFFYSGLLVTGNVELDISELTTRLLGLVVGIQVPYELVAGGSAKQAVHFGQNFRDELFCRFNHGILKNGMIYGKASPPSYDLSKVAVNVTLHYALNDTLLGARDVLDMARDMPNANARRIARDDFNHLDYLASKDVKELVTDFIIKSWMNS